jgi:hypothetical protein
VKTFEDALRSVLSPGHADGLPCAAALYQYAAGEGTLQSDRAFRAHLEACADCRADLEHFTRPVPAPARSRGLGLFTWWRGFAVAAACAAVVMFVKLRSTETPPDSAPTLSPKGATAFHVGVVRDGRTLPWATTDHLLPGDELRFSYSNPSRSYPMLFAADESGTVEQVYPAGSPLLAQPGDGDMGRAEVDTRPGCQWLIAYFVGPGQVPHPETMAAAIRKAVAQRPRGNCELGVVNIEGAEVHIKAKQVLMQ